MKAERNEDDSIGRFKARQVARGYSQVKDVDNEVFFRKIVEIERFALRTAILNECQNYVFDTHPRWLPVTQSTRSRRSYRKVGDCEQSNLDFTHASAPRNIEILGKQN